MPTRAETPDRRDSNPGRPDHAGGVFSILGVDLTALLAALVLIFIAARVSLSQHALPGLADQIPKLDLVMETLTVPMSMLVFMIGWNTFRRQRDDSILVLSFAFLAVGFIDLAHILADLEILGIVLPGDPTISINFWLAARMLAAFALLAAACRPWRLFDSPRTSYRLLGAAMGITVLIYWLVLFRVDALPDTYIPGQGLTSFKIGAEYTLIAVCVLAAVIFLARLWVQRGDYLRQLFAASCIIALSEYLFISYGYVTDINSLLGHAYNVIAYFLVCKALFAHSIEAPYRQLDQSQQTLRESRERLQLALDGSGVALFDANLAGGTVYLSEAWAAMLGEEPKPTVTTFGDLIKLTHPEERKEITRNYSDALSGRSPVYEVQHRVMTRSGEWKWIHSRAKVVQRDESGKVLRLAGTNADISEQKRAENEILTLNAELDQRVVERTQQLTAINKELEAFSYSVSHDLRAPLRAIDGFSQILLKKYADHLDATGSDYLQRVRRASLRMGELIDDLLQLARVSRSAIKAESVDLSRLTTSILAELGTREPQRIVASEVQDGVGVNGDPRLLKIALENLLGNAWKFTSRRADAKIRFGASKKDGEQVIYVEDNGAGFDMKFAHKLFGAFQRLHSAAEFEGTGIGLATVLRILNLHGGRIWADSTPGVSTSFFFVIPPAGGRLPTSP